MTTILGRRRYIPEINNKNQGIRQFAERQAVNTPIQGSASDLIKLAMVEIHQLIKEKKLKITLGVSCALMSENGLEINLMAEKFKELGFNYFVIRPVGQDEMHGIIFDKDLSKKFRKELKLAEACATDTFNVTVRRELFDFEEKDIKRSYKNCLGLPFMACVDANGYVYACNSRWGDKNYVYGDINQESFLNIWNSPEHKEKIRELMETVNTEECPIMCRQNSINEFLWELKHPPDHINFL